MKRINEHATDFLVMAQKGNLLYPVFCNVDFELERIKKCDALKYENVLLKNGYELVLAGIDLVGSFDEISENLIEYISKAPLLAASYLIYEKGLQEDEVFSKIFVSCNAECYVLAIGILNPYGGDLEIYDERSEEASEFAKLYGGYSKMDKLKMIRRTGNKKV